MRYLITGGAGFIGSHVTDILVGRGEGVVILDNLSTGRIENIAVHLDAGTVDFREGDILEPATVAGCVSDVDAVFHLAATVGVMNVVRNPLDSLLNNVRGTENVLEACLPEMKRVFVASTSEIYGKNAAGALKEDADRILGNPFVARWAYSTSKAVDEIFAFNYHRAKGLPTVVGRLFNCSGPRQTGTYGMVLPRFVRQALNGEPLTVFGDGTQARCFCHVHDTSRALVALMDDERTTGDVFNVGSHGEITINGLAQRVLELTGSRSDIKHQSYEEAYEEGFEDMERRMPDIGKIHALLGWAPTKSLDDIILDVIAHERAEMVAR